MGGNYPLRDMDAYVHRQQAGALKCQVVENKINCKAEHPHLSVFPWQTSRPPTSAGPCSVLQAAGHDWGGLVPSCFSGVSFEGNHLGGKGHVPPAMVCKSLFLIQ